MITQTFSLKVRTAGASDFAPSISCYIPEILSSAKREEPRKAVIVCPGGAYVMRSDREGEPIALAFAAAGMAAFVLNYSVVPATYPQALCEAAEAVALVRSHAEEWQIDPKGILVCGFSAGGHLAGSIGTLWDRPEITEALGGKSEDYRPDGMILSYPVISWGEYADGDSIQNLLGEAFSEERAERVSLEKWVTEKTPPAFLWHTASDEAVPVQNSLLYAMAMAKCGNRVELHIYPDGPHGLALSNEITANRTELSGFIHPECTGWINEAIRFAKTL
ncbi:MAG: alpha/beta hydrolase [Ruminococcaceae bacterium]|nr:alpha/beta hydrolase [Oscillospiraceae bacterium]